MQPSISVVIPAYRSARTLPPLVARLDTVLKEIAEKYEIIVVEDCSPDNTWKVLRQLKENYNNLKIVRLLRNSGQHSAILCGLSMAKNEIIITMDDDLQNPPEEIPKLVEAIGRGFDIAIASYDSKKHTGFRNKSGALIDSLLRCLFSLPKDFKLTSFRAVRKIVVDHVVQMGGTFPYITAMLLSHTSKYVNVAVVHEERPVGRSNYNLIKSLRLAARLLLHYSGYPLYLTALLCFGVLGGSVVLGGWVLWRSISTGDSIQGWASVMTGIMFFNAITLPVLVIGGIYVSRLARQQSRSRVGFSVGEVYE